MLAMHIHYAVSGGQDHPGMAPKYPDRCSGEFPVGVKMFLACNNVLMCAGSAVEPSILLPNFVDMYQRYRRCMDVASC